MTGSKLDQANILAGTFRANPDYEMVLFDRLPEEQQSLLAGLEKDPQFYGILRPRPGAAALATKSVCRDTALLFATMAAGPGPLPRYVLREAGAGAGRTVAELVMDGVLAMQAGSDWLSGASALSMLGAAFPESLRPDARHRLARLSWDAIEYAAALSLTDAALLAARLYNYNSLPVSPARLWSLPTAADLERLHPPPSRHWAAIEPTPQSEGWSAWRTRRAASRQQQSGSLYKLYVSPMPEGLADAFRVMVTAAAEWGALQFKAGRSGHELLRPDKLVAYFPSLPSLEAAAAQIQDALRGCPAQGVPFTASIGGAAEVDGLVSWGFDPPPDPAAPEWLRRESWRLKLANRLGAALAHAKTNPADRVSAASFARERLRLDGIDTETWSPMTASQPQQPEEVQ